VIGVQFNAVNSSEVGGGSDELRQRVDLLEADISVLKRLVAKLRARLAENADGA
jgi:hypothetical protein